MYSIKLIDDTYFHINNEDYNRIIVAVNHDINFIEITARYTKFKDIKILLNVKYILYIKEEQRSVNK